MQKMSFKERIKDFNIFILLISVFFISILGGVRFGRLFLCLNIFLFVSVLIANKGKFYFGTLNKIYGILTLFLSFSALYAIKISYSLEVLIYVWSVNFVMLILYDYCRSKERIIKVIKWLILIGFTFSLINVLFTRLGQRELFYGGVNPVAFAVFICIMFTIWLAFNKQYFYLLFIPVFMLLLFITASQKTILSLFIVFFLYLALLIYYLKFKPLLKILISCIFVLGVSFYIFSNHPLLQYSYVRTAATIETLLTGERVSRAAGGSDGGGIRSELKRKGIEYISNRPIWGYGVNNFRVLLRNDIGVETYSHNTPIELAIAIGIFGVIIYYSLFAFVSYRLLKKFKRDKELDSLFLIACSVAVIVIGLYMQLYFDPFAHIFLILAFCYASTKTKSIVAIN